MPDATGLQFTARVGDFPADHFVVCGFHLDEALSSVFSGTLSLASTDPAVVASKVLDQPVALKVFQDGELQRQFTGVVREFSRNDTGHRRTRYEVVMQPALWRLGLRHNSRIFQGQRPEAIVNTLLSERGGLEPAFDLKRPGPEREYCVQHRESDLAFLQRLAAEEGWHYRFDGAQSNRVVIADHHGDATGLAEALYNPTPGTHTRQRAVHRFQVRERVGVDAVTLQDYTFKNPAYALYHEAEHASQSSQISHYDYPGRFKTDASGEPFTRVRLEALRNHTAEAGGRSNRPDLIPGARLSLTGHDEEACNRPWLLTRVSHTGEQPQALEEEAGEAPTTYHNHFSAIPAERTWRPDPPARAVMDGPQIATVTGPEGEEIHCDEHGRVKVRFPWDRADNADEHTSAWLRVSQGWAGGQYGFMALPRIGHEVIVSFLDGDPDQPLITGRTYHARNTAPYSLPQHKTRTTLKTRTHKGEGSNELRFEDEAEQQQIYLHAQKNLDLLTRNNRTEVIRNDSHLTVENHRFEEVRGDDHETIGGESRTRIGGDFSQTIGGNFHQKVAGSTFSEAAREVHQHGGKVVLDAGVELTIVAGGSFLKLDPSGVTLSGPTLKINSGGAPGIAVAQAAQEPELPQSLNARGSKENPVQSRSAIAGASQEPGNVTSTASASPVVEAPMDSEPDVGPIQENESPEPGFHVVRSPMRKTELIAELYGDALAKPDHFDRLNPGLGDQLLPGEMVVVGDPEGQACTREEADLMTVAREVNSEVQGLEQDEAQFIVDHYDLLETLTQGAQSGLGVGAVMIGRQLGTIESGLREMEKVHQNSFRKHGHLNSPDFFAERRKVLKKLDFALGKIARRGLSLDDNPKLKRSLGLSTKSIVHDWKKAGVGDLPGYGRPYAKLASGARYMRGAGYLAIGLDAGLSASRIREACTEGSEEECEVVTYKETGRFIGGTIFAGIGGVAAATSCAVVAGVTAGIGSIACGIVMAGVGSAAGGSFGSKTGIKGGELVRRAVNGD